MASTFTTNKTLELPGNGDYVNTWNIPVNGDMSIIDQALGGTTSLNASAGSVTLTVAQYRSLILSVSGAMSANVTYTIPAGVGGQWIVSNQTTNFYSLTFASATGGGSTITVAQGTIVLIACDGTNFTLVSSSLTPTGGGTNKIFYLNEQTVTSNYTIPTGDNAGTFGPVAINPGATVTIPAGSYWSVV
jgi:hypothetical protein